MEKNVGSVDIEELKLARQALDKERGIESDPNMYSNYNPNRSKEENSSEVSTEIDEQMFENSNSLEDEMISNANELDSDIVAKSESEESLNNEESIIDENQEIFIDENTEDIESNAKISENQIDESDVSGETVFENAISNQDSNSENSSNKDKSVEDDTSGEIDFSVYDSFADFEVESNKNIIANDMTDNTANESEIENQDNIENESETQDNDANELEEETQDNISNESEIEVQDNVANLEEINQESEEENDITKMLMAELEKIDSSEQENTSEEYKEDTDSVEINDTETEENDLVNDTNSFESEEIAKNEEISDAELNEYVVDETNDSEKQEEDLSNNEPKIDAESQVEVESKDSEEIARLEAQIEELKAKLKDAEELEKTQEESEMVENYATDAEDDYDAINSLMESLEGLKPIDLTEEEKKEIDEKRRISEERRKDEELQIIDDFKKLERLDRILSEDVEEEQQPEVIEVTPKISYPLIDEVNFVDVISTEEFKSSDNLSYILGKDEEGKIHYGNLRDFYNMVIFSKDNNSAISAVHSVLVSLILKNSTNDINFVICDSKADSKLQIYNKSSYMYFNRLAKTNKEILDTLIEISKELEERYKILAAAGVKSIEQYNIIAKNDNLRQLPYIVTVFNNYTKSMQLADADKINIILHQILKLGRIVGLYLIVVGNMRIMSDDINYNLPTRLSFQVPDEEDSLSMLGESGPEMLEVDDEFLLLSLDSPELVHLKVPSVSTKELEILIKNIES